MQHELIARIGIHLQNTLLKIGDPVFNSVNAWKIDFKNYLGKRRVLQWITRDVDITSLFTFHVLLPLPCRWRSFLVDCRSNGSILLLAGQLIIGEPLPNDLAHGDIEPISIVHLAVVVAERLFIQVAEQVEWLDAKRRFR